MLFFPLLFVGLLSSRPAFAIENVLLFDRWSGTQVLIEYSDDSTEIVGKIHEGHDVDDLMHIWTGANFRLRSLFAVNILHLDDSENEFALVLSDGSVLISDDWESESHDFRYFPPPAAASIFGSAIVSGKNPQDMIRTLFANGEYLAQVDVTAGQIGALFEKVDLDPVPISLAEMMACSQDLVGSGAAQNRPPAEPVE